jgi:hypothetical protein
VAPHFEDFQRTIQYWRGFQRLRLQTLSKKSQRFFQRKMAKNNRALAIKALANKLSKANFFMMRDQVPYDAEKLFG